MPIVFRQYFKVNNYLYVEKCVQVAVQKLDNLIMHKAELLFCNAPFS